MCHRYLLDAPRTAAGVLSRLAERFPTRRENGLAAARTYLDTFDWRLYRDAGTILSDAGDGSCSVRWDRFDGGLRHRATMPAPPDFARDLPPGGFRDELQAVTDIRRLLPMVRIDRRSERISVVDGRDKAVVRLSLDHGTAAGSTRRRRRLPTILRLARMTGYERAYRGVRRFVEEDLELAPGPRTELDLALSAVGRRPGDYTGKLELRLDPDERTDRAVKRILAALWEMMQANEAGLRADLDPEFLHDFRVAVRRTRSCLGQVGGVFDEAVTRRFADEFAWLGRLTGPPRDLDVHLLSLRGHRAELPPSARGDLSPLAEHLKLRREAAHAEQLAGLDSARYRRLKREWRRLLETDADGGGANAARPIRGVAGERIVRAFARVRKRGRGLSAETPAEAVHELRIACKKLRYLLEFFRSLYGAAPVSAFIRSLKRLQDDLGEYNDLEVQQGELQDTARELLAAGGADAPALLTAGRLVDRLESRQAAARRRLADEVGRFATARTAADLDRLLASRPQAPGADRGSR